MPVKKKITKSNTTKKTIKSSKSALFKANLAIPQMKPFSK